MFYLAKIASCTSLLNFPKPIGGSSVVLSKKISVEKVVFCASIVRSTTPRHSHRIVSFLKPFLLHNYMWIVVTILYEMK